MSDNFEDEKEQFLKFKREIIDPISPSFCAAKWYNATIWLNSGRTTSCHHPPHHSINVEEIADNPSAIHNTKEKKKQRELMLNGHRPGGCEYCWVLEDMDKNAVSDRVFKTNIYSKEDIEKIKDMDPQEDVVLKTLEVAFDSTCNFACAYCNSSFSTKWAKDILSEGPYLGLKHIDGKAYKDNGAEARQYKDSDENPHIQAFWRWWPDLVKELQEFRITGGEPLMSKDTWRVFDYFEKHGSKDVVFAINSNLGAMDSLIDKLIDKSAVVETFDLYTSCEAVGGQAEFVRDGLDYKKFCKNLEKVFEQGNFRSVNVMMTINLLSMSSVVEFLDQMVTWKMKYGTHKPTWTVNLLRFPAFLSGINLPDHLKDKYRGQLIEWLHRSRDLDVVLPHEIASIERLIDYLKVVAKPHRLAKTGEINNKDLKMFLRQYEKRRNKSVQDVFPSEFVEWYKSI